MYHKILVALENSQSDESLLPHVTELAHQLGSELLLLHVADGWVARNFEQLKLAESEEMKADRAYLASTARKLDQEGITVSTQLAMGNPPDEILRTAEEQKCDLIAMTTHGHRWLGDLLFGSTIHEVRHKSTIPILLVRAAKKAQA
jgi:nucleotide-binding universal stress UspA family protein